MNNFYRYFIIASLTFLMLTPQEMLAGNKDRSGQAGASELLINPWARSTGWGNAGMAQIRGLEGIWSNVAGTAFTKNRIDFCPYQLAARLRHQYLFLWL